MRIWPVLLDSQPSYLGGRGRSESLLLAPLGTRTVLEHLHAWLGPITKETPLVVSQASTGQEYARWIDGLWPGAVPVTTAVALADRAAALELSDAVLLVDPGCLPMRPEAFSLLVHEHAVDPRASHHLVAFEGAVAGTKERVSLDATGHVRKILRHYEHATWSFISGVAATILPVASGIIADGTLAPSLTVLRQILTSRGIPGRDVTVQGGVFDLSQEAGLLAANEYFVRKVTAGCEGGSTSPIFVGS